jgi:hypothetical protein
MQLGDSLAGTDHVDPMLLQVAEQILRLLGRELRLLQRRLQGLGRQETLLLTLRNDPLQLLDLHHGRSRGDQQTIKLLAQLDSQGLL